MMTRRRGWRSRTPPPDLSETTRLEKCFMRALVNPDPFCVPLASIPLDTDVTSLILPDLTSLHLLAIHSLRQHCFDKSIPSSALYNDRPRQHPRFVTKAVLSEPQRLQARTNHTTRWPALERHHAAVRRRAAFSFCFIAVARRVKARGLCMP